MTRKLVVMVFAISLSVIGCGSDDGDTKDTGVRTDTSVKSDTSPDSKVDTVVKDGSPDVVKAEVKAEVASEVKPDVPVTTDVQPTTDGGVVDAPVATDTPVGLDTGSTGGSDAGDAGMVD